MSEILEAKDLPMVTSLSDTDTLLAVGGDGKGKRISETNVGKRLISTKYSSSDARWIRIAGFFHSGSAGIISVWNEYYHYCPRPVMLAYCFTDSRWKNPGNLDARLLCGDTTVFTKVRWVHPDASGTLLPV